MIRSTMSLALQNLLKLIVTITQSAISLLQIQKPFLMFYLVSLILP